MNKLLSLNYWFDLRAGELAPIAQKALIIFILILAILLIISYFITRSGKFGTYKKLLNRVKSFSWTNIIIGAFLLFFTYEMIPFLSSRFWFILWAIGMIIWIGFIVKNILEIPAKKELIEKEKEFKKYIP